MPTAPILSEDELKKEAEGLYGEDWAAQLNAAAEGDIITFGFYEQDGDFENGREPIEWILLKKDGTKHTLISRWMLDFIDDYELIYAEDWDLNYSWETCFMRSWLHETFLANAFPAEAMSYIEPEPFSYTLIEGEPAIETVDSVYLLTPEEAIHYFPAEVETPYEEEIQGDAETPEHAQEPVEETELLCNGTPYFINVCGHDCMDWALRGTKHNEYEFLISEGIYSNAFSFGYGSEEGIGDAYGFSGPVRPVLTVNTDPDSVAAQNAQREQYGDDIYRLIRCSYEGSVEKYELAMAEIEHEQAQIAEYGSEWKDLCLNAVEGEKVTFGSYEQDNDLTNGAEPISWLVLKKTDGELWLLSEFILDNVPYHKGTVDFENLIDDQGVFCYLENGEMIPYTFPEGWQGCDICNWLNNDFASAAFTEQQRKCLKSSNSVIMENYGEKPVFKLPADGTAPAEQIRLLTFDEGITFLFNGEALQDSEGNVEYVFEYTIPDESYLYWVYLLSADGTPYAIANGLDVMTDYASGEWWLLTDEIDLMSGAEVRAKIVDEMGSIGSTDAVNNGGARPLICIDLAPVLPGEAEAEEPTAESE